MKEAEWAAEALMFESPRGEKRGPENHKLNLINGLPSSGHVSLSKIYGQRKSSGLANYPELRKTLSPDPCKPSLQKSLVSGIELKNLNEDSQAISGLPVRDDLQDKGFRLTEKAQNYSYVHRPFEDALLRAKKERDVFKKEMYGVKGSPKRSADRHINKIFDHGRQRSKETG